MWNTFKVNNKDTRTMPTRCEICSNNYDGRFLWKFLGDAQFKGRILWTLIFLQILWSIEKNIECLDIFRRLRISSISSSLWNVSVSSILELVFFKIFIGAFFHWPKYAFLISFLAANHERQLKSPNSINYFDFALTLKLPGVKP